MSQPKVSNQSQAAGSDSGKGKAILFSELFDMGDDGLFFQVTNFFELIGFGMVRRGVGLTGDWPGNDWRKASLTKSRNVLSMQPSVADALAKCKATCQARSTKLGVFKLG